jgi:hypothetical protein
MARLRTIKPEMYTNDDLARCSLAARYLFPGLWCYADRRGILEDRPLRLKANLYPFDDVDVNVLLQELHDAGFIRRYTAGGVRCIAIVKFTKHQNPHIHEKPNDLPDPPIDTEESVQPSGQHGASTVQEPDKHSTSTAPICLTELSCELSYGVEAGEPAPPPAAKPKRATRMTNDWRPGPGVRKVADELGMSDTERKSELVKFRDHFLANGKAMANWDAAAQNWLRRSKDFAPIPIRRNGRPAASLSDQMDQWVREIEEGR